MKKIIIAFYWAIGCTNMFAQMTPEAVLGLRKENGKEIVDYYDVRNFEIVHTAPYVEKDWF